MSESFSSQEVADACGVSFRRVDYWVRQGYVQMDSPPPGFGHSRRWSFNEALQVLLTAELAATGVAPGTVRVPDMRFGSWSLPGTSPTVTVSWDEGLLVAKLREKLGVVDA